MKNRYNELDVIKDLEKKHDIRVQGHNIWCLRGEKAKCDVGIKSKGKIDFLVTYCSYFFSFISKFD